VSNRPDGRPWLLIDIDGVLNPSLSDREAAELGIRVSHAHDEHGRRWRMLLRPEHGQWLLGMTDVFQLAWCTTWQDLANTRIGPRIGLPKLPVVAFDFSSAADGPSKVPGILRHVGRDPFCWLDDDVWPVDRTHLSGIPNPHTVIEVDPNEGLLPKHLAHARSWAERLPPPA